MSPADPEVAAVVAGDPALAAGVSRQEGRYVRALAGMVVGGDLDALGDLDDDSARAALQRVPGIGPWTADVHLPFVLRRPVFPVGDRALQVGAAEVLGLATPPSDVELEALASRWAPHRSAAARTLWHAHLSRRGRTM